MTVANMEAFALSKGINKSWNEMSQAEQVALRYDYIMEASAKKLGDFAKTSDSLANKQRTLKGRLDTLSESVGNLLLPTLEKLLGIFDDLLKYVMENIPGLDKLILIFGSLVAAIAPVVVAIGAIVIGFGGLVGAITAVVALISTVGLPVFAGITAALLALPVAIIAIVAPMIAVQAAIVALLAKLGIFSDAIATIKALISGDFNKVFELLTKRFGMSSEQAEILAKSFTEMYRKAKIVLTVIKDNLIPILVVLKDYIIDLVTGGFSKLNGSTQESQNLFVNMVQTITKWGSKLFNYLYSVFDQFGLIPNKLKFANNQIALEFIDLNSKAQANLDNLLNSQFIFGQKLTEKNLEIYNKKFQDTKTSMDAELLMVIDQLNKRKVVELTALQNLFNESNVLTATEEEKRVNLLIQHYTTEQEQLNNNNLRIQEILTNASNQKRELTANEVFQIEKLRQDSMNRSVQYVSDSEAEQIRIMEEAKNAKTQITKDEAMNIITEANRAYDETVKKAEEQKNEKIRTIIDQRDNVKSITADEADAMIKEAETEYKETTTKAEKTRKETVNSAAKKADGIIDEAEREKREVTTQTDNIKKAMKTIWNDIKKEIPSIVVELIGDIASAIADNADLVTSAAYDVGAALVQAIIDGITSKIDSLRRKLAALAAVMAKTTIDKITGSATGVRNSPGEWSMVGEHGMELMYIPKGASIYNNSETKSMLKQTQPRTLNTPRLSGGSNGFSGTSKQVVFNGDVIIDAKSVQEFNNIIGLLKNVEKEVRMR